ncbi:MAG: hypothetical protein JWN47_1562 [Frankiales bacterium]|nr:hypothetical protein [Frankiales bacterium]
MRSIGIVLTALLMLLPLACTSSEKGTIAPSPPPTATPSPSRTARPSPQPPVLAPPALRQYCRAGDPLKGVYRPARLKVKSRCAAVTGVASAMDIEHDGDLHISLTAVPDNWLNGVNRKRSRGDLVVEAVPQIPISRPPQGARITVIGPWVLDSETGWLEIHPVWKIIVEPE